MSGYEFWTGLVVFLVIMEVVAAPIQGIIRAWRGKK